MISRRLFSAGAIAGVFASTRRSTITRGEETDMGFHGTIEKQTLDAFTPLTDGGQLIGVGGDSGFLGGLSTYSELVVMVSRGIPVGPTPAIVEVQFYPSDDPTIAEGGNEVTWSQWFTVDLSVDSTPGIWRIPLAAGTVRVINHSTTGSGTFRLALYGTQSQHSTIIQEGANGMPRHYQYTGALTNGGKVHLPAADGLGDKLTGNGIASVSIDLTTAVDCTLRWAFDDAAGNPCTPLVGAIFTNPVVMNDVALPGIPVYLSLFSSSAVAAVTVDVWVIPASTG